MAGPKQALTYIDPERDERVTLPVDAETAFGALFATPPIAEATPTPRAQKPRRRAI